MAFPLPTITPDYILKGGPKEFTTKCGIGKFIFQKIKEAPARIAMIDAASEQEKTTYEILQDAVTIAENLKKMGVRPGDVVALMSENRLEYAPAMLAILFIGASCAPLNPLYSTDELKHTASISRPSIIFCSPFTAQKVLEFQETNGFVRKIIVFGDVDSDESFLSYRELLLTPGNLNTFQPTQIDDLNSTAVLLCSSGTTGLPKCVELTDNNLLANIEIALSFIMEEETDERNLIGLIPFFHGYGFIVLLLTLLSDAKMIVMSMFKEELFLQTIQKYRISVLAAVPPLLVFLAKHPLVSKYDLSSLTKIRCGAAPLSKELQIEVENKFKNCDVAQGYGMTELSIACVFTPKGKNKQGSCGVVCPGMECKVIDIDTGKALPPFKEGELCFKGPFIMKGYKNNKKATDETIDKAKWLHTGDVGYYDEEGYLYIVDRLKELIKFKGFQVAPAELEAILLAHPDVKDAAVIGIPDEEAGELPFAFVVKQPDTNPTKGDILKFVADKVSPQKRLSGGVRFVEEIPKNPSGKILRRDLRILYKSSSKL